MGSAVIYLLGRHRPPAQRLAAMVALGILAGLVAALVTNVVIGAFPGHFLAAWGVATLFYLALGLSIAAFQVLVGAGGIAIGAVMFLVIGNPASGGSSAPELLPGFWRALSQLLPPGAATTAIRDVVYFHGHGTSGALLGFGSGEATAPYPAAVQWSHRSRAWRLSQLICPCEEHRTSEWPETPSRAQPKAPRRPPPRR
jgi:hypothetical protein